MAPRDSIVLTGLKISCIIGIFEWERKRKQDVLIDLKFPCDIRRAAQRDHIQETVDYKKIAKATIAFVEKSKFQLIETLAERLAAFLLENFRLSEIELNVSKPGAIRGSQNVGIQIHRSLAHMGLQGMVFLGLGSNMNPRQNLGMALAEIQKKFLIVGLSHVYETSPVVYARQAAFWNLVVGIETSDSLKTVRKWLEAVEKMAGRRRSSNRNAPRTLDVDLLLWGDRVEKNKDFDLPHPDIATKAFALFPLLEISPNLVHPSLRKPLIELAVDFRDPTQKIRQLPDTTFKNFPPQKI